MDTGSNGSEPVGKQRNEKGHWIAGISGNPKGRPRSKSASPKRLTDHLADALAEKIPLMDSEGKLVMVPAGEAVAKLVVRSFPTMKPRELMGALRWLDELQVFDEMRKRAGTSYDHLTREECEARLTAKLRQLAERQRLGNVPGS